MKSSDISVRFLCYFVWDFYVILAAFLYHLYGIAMVLVWEKGVLSGKYQQMINRWSQEAPVLEPSGVLPLCRSPQIKKVFKTSVLWYPWVFITFIVLNCAEQFMASKR